MEWHQLVYFRTVARISHFTQAAEQLSISQPALSRSITQLEQELGTQLFDRRRGRSVVLNAYGKVFLTYVEQAFQNLQEGKQRIEEMMGIAHGTVSLAFLHTLGVHLVPDLVGGFHKQYPEIKFQLTQNTSEVMPHQLESGDIDLCLCLEPKSKPNIRWQQLYSEELYVIVPLNHHLAKRTAIRLADVAEEPFISLKRGIGLRAITDALCAQAGFDPKIAFEGEEIPTIAGLVGAGLGVSLVPSLTKFDPARTSLLRVTAPICRRDIGIAWIDGRKLSLAAERFKDFVLDPGSRKDHAGNMEGWENKHGQT